MLDIADEFDTFQMKN